MKTEISNEWKIREALVYEIMQVSQKYYPNEFAGMLGVGEVESHYITELVVVPYTSGKTFAEFRWDLIPFDPLIVGTIHSHPSYSLHPSIADASTFSKLGKIHVIVAKPFSIDHFQAYDSQSRRVEMKRV